MLWQSVEYLGPPSGGATNAVHCNGRTSSEKTTCESVRIPIGKIFCMAVEDCRLGGSAAAELDRSRCLAAEDVGLAARWHQSDLRLLSSSYGSDGSLLGRSARGCPLGGLVRGERAVARSQRQRIRCVLAACWPRSMPLDRCSASSPAGPTHQTATAADIAFAGC